MGKVLLEYQLFPDKFVDESPHVVIWSHAANDAEAADMDAVYYQHLHDFIQAARNLRPCDDDLPAIILVDDNYAQNKTRLQVMFRRNLDDLRRQI